MNDSTKQLTKSLLILSGMSIVLTLLTLPLAKHLQPETGTRLCLLAGLTCFLAGLGVLLLPRLFPVAETYVMVVALGFGVRMLFPLIACGVLITMVGLAETRVFAICLLIISPVLLFWETWTWTRLLSETSKASETPEIKENK